MMVVIVIKHERAGPWLTTKAKSVVDIALYVTSGGRRGMTEKWGARCR